MVEQNSDFNSLWECKFAEKSWKLGQKATKWHSVSDTPVLNECCPYLIKCCPVALLAQHLFAPTQAQNLNKNVTKIWRKKEQDYTIKNANKQTQPTSQFMLFKDVNGNIHKTIITQAREINKHMTSLKTTPVKNKRSNSMNERHSYSYSQKKEKQKTISEIHTF